MAFQKPSRFKKYKQKNTNLILFFWNKNCGFLEAIVLVVFQLTLKLKEKIEAFQNFLSFLMFLEHNSTTKFFLLRRPARTHIQNYANTNFVPNIFIIFFLSSDVYPMFVTFHLSRNWFCGDLCMFFLRQLYR